MTNTDQIYGRLPLNKVRERFGENISGHSISFTISKLNLFEVLKHFTKPRNVNSMSTFQMPQNRILLCFEKTV